MPRLSQLLLGFLLALAIGGVAYWRKSLSRSGVLGAVLIGTTVFGLGGWEWGVLLVAFFISSSALSHFKESLKESLAEKFSKGHRRDLAQTLANGGAGALCVLGYAVYPHTAWWFAFVGAMATVNADTWATELGVLSRARPKLIFTNQEVERGTAGGVTLFGSMAAAWGAIFIGFLGGLFYGSQAVDSALNQYLRALAVGDPVGIPDPGGIFRSALFAVLLWGTVGGFLGALFDSVLGASVQAIYFCDHCKKETERHPTHSCGHPTRQVRGWRWLDNDWVNFLSSVVGAALAAGFWWILG